MTPPDGLSVTLEAQAWEAIMRVMAKSPVPYEVTAPLIAAIQFQCARQQTDGEQSLAQAPREQEAGE
jgi:hypothetical protein